MKLTHRGRQVDRIIEQALEPVVQTIVRRLPGVEAVLLGGGFGRGEGSVELVRGKPIPVNDVELFAITSHKVPETIVNEVANAAIATFPKNVGSHDFNHFNRLQFSDTFYVDLKVIPKQSLPTLLPMIRYVELKNGSQILWGQDLRDLIPAYEGADLPRAEGLRILLNRLSLCLLYFDITFFKQKLSPPEAKALRYLAGKSLVDIPTALLLLTNKFVPSYEQRARRFAKTYKRDFPELAQQYPDLAAEVTKATKFKLKPTFSPVKNPITVWTNYKRLGGVAAMFFLKAMSGNNRGLDINTTSIDAVINDLKKTMASHYYYPYLRAYVKHKFGIPFFPPFLTWFFQRYYNALMCWRMWRLQGRLYLPLLWAPYGYDIHLFSAMLALLYGLNSKGKVDKRMFALAYQNLVAIYPVSVLAKFKSKKFKSIQANRHNWQKVNTVFADAYILFGYLKLV